MPVDREKIRQTVEDTEIWNIVQHHLGDLGPFVSEVVKRYLPPE